MAEPLRIRVRRDTLANFVAADVVPANGEPIGIINPDDGKVTAYLIGDGVTTVDQLPALSKGDKGEPGQDGAPGLPGTNGVATDDATAQNIRTEGTETRAAVLEAIDDSVVNTLGQYELMPYYNLGDSWADMARSNYTAGASPQQRLGKRLDVASITARGASSRTVEDIANFTLGGPWGWVPRSKALVTLTSCHLNNTKYLGTAAPAQRGYKHACRALFSALTANAAIASNTAAFAYSPGWTSETTQSYTSATGSSTPAQGTVVSTGGSRWTTTTVGAYALVNVAADIVDLFLVARVAGAGVATVTDNTSGTTLGVLDLTAAVAQETPAVLRLTGLGTGTRTLRITHSSGASLTVDSVRIPLSAPVPIVAAPAPDMPVNSTNSLPSGDPSSSYHEAQQKERAWMTEVAADFPTVTICDLNDHGFTDDDFYTDHRHLNDKGSAKWASAVQQHLAGLGYSRGLNTTGSSDPAAYTPPAPPTVPSGGQDGTGAGAVPPPAGTDTPISGASYDFGSAGLPLGTLPQWGALAGGTPLAGAATVQDDGGGRYVRINGATTTGDYMESAAPTRTIVETEAIVFRAPVISSTNRFIASAYSASPTRTVGFNSLGTAFVTSDGTALMKTTAPLPDTAWHVIIVVRNGTNSVLSVDGVELAGNIGTATAVSGIRLANSAGGVNRGQFDIRRAVIIPSALDASARTALYNQLHALVPTA
ncbi:hypothetical protein [Curtobacterium sp. MCSS17_015]|uniref:hypothetical protein n=1 Tax=Curtobacterium sp. MCSS17_015 TaxID=2175666 RepID=UPI000DAA1C1D|nr:hypothetical protein [Curtobacterium sp. MCSS17_015]WIB25801.1 hypothetical protein DEJ18_12185 [Curtobacterium sp. MCSS17_015]